MGQNKIYKVIVLIVFGAILVVPAVIGISLYSKPVPPLPPPPKPVAYPTPIYYPTTIPTPYVQNRQYVYGNAFDSSSQAAIINKKINYGNNLEVLISYGGYFYIPVDASTTKLTLSIDGYNSKEIDIGTGYNVTNTMQSLGTVFFDPAAIMKSPVEVYTKVDPEDKLTKLYYNDPQTQAQIKLNDDNVISFKQSPDLKRVAYVYKDDIGKMGATVLDISKPLLKQSRYYAKDKPTTKIAILGWIKNSCCVVWMAQDVEVGSWGTEIEYYDTPEFQNGINVSGTVINPLTGGLVFNRVGKVLLAPNGPKVLVQYYYTDTDGKEYDGLALQDIMTHVPTGMQRSNKVATIKDFHFDEKNRVNYKVYYSDMNMYTWNRFDSDTGANDTWDHEPPFWKNLK